MPEPKDTMLMELVFSVLPTTDISPSTSFDKRKIWVEECVGRVDWSPLPGSTKLSYKLGNTESYINLALWMLMIGGPRLAPVRMPREDIYSTAHYIQSRILSQDSRITKQGKHNNQQAADVSLAQLSVSNP